MQRGAGGRASRASRLMVRQRRSASVAALLLASAVGGCASDAPVRLASIGGATVAFESIDGPPPPVFHKLVATLNDEAAARRLPVVSRAEPATYRVRGYVSAVVDRRKVSFAWVWDVYDAEKRRRLRIAGEEPAQTGPRDAWAAADEALLRRMAQNGMKEIAAFLGSPEPLPAAPDPVAPLPEQAVALVARH